MKVKCLLVGLFAMTLFHGVLKCQVKTDSLLLNFDSKRIHRQQTAMIILGTWSVANLATGIALRSNSTGDNFYFHEMNAGWNAVNLAIAGSGLLALRKQKAASNAFEGLENSLKFEKSLLFNAGMDLAYIATGVYLLERGMNENTLKNRQRFRGYGRSIILQGAFLFLFDSVLYHRESRFSSALRKGMQNVYLSPEGLGFGISF
jgi:hypothetical protein